MAMCVLAEEPLWVGPQPLALPLPLLLRMS